MENETYSRFLNRDGTFNIDRKGLKRPAFTDLYHFLLSTSWTALLGILVVLYLSVNVLFGLGYFLCGARALEGVRTESVWLHAMDCFFFSVQTLATIGYGRISPVTILPNLLVTAEALVGMLGLALATGLVFGRFSRPTARVVFSSKAILVNHDGIPSLIFRIGNARLNQIVEAQISVILARTETTKEGEVYRNIYDLKLERNRSPLFAMSWTIVHPILPDSPLYGVSDEQMREAGTEIIVALSGIDDTLSATIHSRFSYTVDDIERDMWFVDMVSRAENGRVRLNLDKIDLLQKNQS